jgi:hypothetical protein
LWGILPESQRARDGGAYAAKVKRENDAQSARETAELVRTSEARDAVRAAEPGMDPQLAYLKADIMEMLRKAGNRADAPENGRIAELFKQARDRVYASAGPKPNSRNRIATWQAKRTRAWENWCNRDWRTPDGMVFVVGTRFANGYIKLAPAI